MHTAPLLMIAAALCSSVALALSCTQEQHDLADWFPPGVTVGEGVLVKKQLARVEGLGGIEDVVLGRLDGAEQAQLIVCGSRGYVLLDPRTGEERSRVSFEPSPELGEDKFFGRPRILDVDGDGRLDFALLGENWVSKTSVRRADGTALWVHPTSEDLAPNLTVCGDLDGDGTLEFLMAFNAWREVDLLNAQGELLWRQEWTQLHSDNVQFFDTDGDGTLEIVYVDGTALWVRDRHGELLSRVVPPAGGYANALDILEGWGDPPEQHLLVGSHVKRGDQKGQQFYVFSADGKQHLETVTWEAMQAYIKTLPVRFPGAEDALLARWDLLHRQAWPAGYDASRLRLQVYSADHDLVYEEILKDAQDELAFGGGIFAVPSGSGDPNSRLLVGFGPSLWEYSLPE